MNDSQPLRLALLVTLAAFATTAPVASALVPLGTPSSHFVGDTTSGRFMLACAGPNFTNCSFALAAAASFCRDIPYAGEVCAGASLGVAGGASSAAVTGGGAWGTLGEGIVADCTWSGLSGGCASVQVELGFYCAERSVVAEGYLAAEDALLFGPAATARAGNCTAADAELLARARSTTAVWGDERGRREVEQALRAELDEARAQLPREAWGVLDAAMAELPLAVARARA